MFKLLITYQEFDGETGETVGQGQIYQGDDVTLKELLHSLQDLGHVAINRYGTDNGLELIELNTLDADIDYADGSHRHLFASIEGPSKALARLPNLIRSN